MMITSTIIMIIITCNRFFWTYYVLLTIPQPRNLHASWAWWVTHTVQGPWRVLISLARPLKATGPRDHCGSASPVWVLYPPVNQHDELENSTILWWENSQTFDWAIFQWLCNELPEGNMPTKIVHLCISIFKSCDHHFERLPLWGSHLMDAPFTILPGSETLQGWLVID